MLALTYPHIEKSDDQPAHLQRLPRIRVAQIVMDYIAYGWSVEEICRQHPECLTHLVSGVAGQGRQSKE